VNTGLEWQCVELVNRLYAAKGWITTRWTGSGNTMYSTAPAQFKKEPQNSITYLAPGDVVSFNTGKSGGHVAIVSSVSANNAITFVNQNTPKADVYSSGQLSGGKLTMSGWASTFAPIGVVHAPGLKRPAQPTNARVTSTTTTSAALSWTDASNNETGFVSQYKIGSGSWVAGKSVGANQKSMTITGLKANTKYTFQVGSHNSAGTNWGPYFYGTTAKTASAPPPAPPAPAPAPAAYHTGRQVKIAANATTGVSGHLGPNNTYASNKATGANQPLWIVCYVTGQSITNSYYKDTTTMWDLSDDGYYYSDAWLYTGTNGAAVPACRLKSVPVDKYATGGLSGHTGPGNNYTAGPVHGANTPITIACYVTGQSITNSHYNDTTTIWDLAVGGYYYSDAWLYTGTNGAAVPHC
jgi:hypothetical protein